MEKKINVKLGKVQRTLLFPLWGRAREATKNHPLIVDKTSIDMVRRLDYDFSTIERNIREFSQLTWVVRDINNDAAVRKFLVKNPMGTVINIGCGLDTIFERVDNGNVRWYDLDMPDTIELRKKLIPESDRRRCIAKSVFDTTWFDEVETEDGVLFVAGGILYYFEEEDIKKLFVKIAEKFPGSEMIFDMESPFGMKAANRAVIKNGGMDEGSFLKWSMKSAKEIEGWDARLKVVEEYPYFRELTGRSEMKFSTRVMIWISEKLRMIYMVHLRFGDVEEKE